MLDDVYLDTSVVLAALIEGVPHHRAALEHCRYLRQAQCNVYFSQLLRIELLQAIRVVGTSPDMLSEVTRRRYRLARWGSDLSVRRRWMTEGAERFEQLLREFARVVEIPHTLGIWSRSIEAMCAYHLKSYDATHAATAIELGLTEFLTVDGDFDRVHELSVTLVRDVLPN